MNNFLKTTTLCTIGLTLACSSVRAQIVTDGSLSTQITQQGVVTEITGGEQAGSNLFHSFRDFSLPTGNEAFFNNQLSIENILSRITGGNISNIDGLIRANGTANLFLINPAGIIFGENARLELGGSFFGSTATGVNFEDGSEFNVNDTQPALTINAPIGLNLRGSEGQIDQKGELASNLDLTLAAQHLNLEGQLLAEENLSLEATKTLTARDSNTNPFILKAGQNLTLEAGLIDLQILKHEASGLFAGNNINLVSDRPINGDAYFFSAGAFQITRPDGSLGDLISLKDPVIQSLDDVSLASYEGASLHIQSGGNVTVDGDITITGADTTNSALQETVTLSNGKNIAIDGSEEPTLDIRSGTNSVDFLAAVEQRETPPVRSGSNISIKGNISNAGGKVLLTNQYQPNLDLAAGNISVASIDTSNPSGNGGQVVVDSRNNIAIPNSINTSSASNAQLTTDASVTEATPITVTSGNGGLVTLFASNDISTGDINSSSQINLKLNTTVDTIDEANTGFAFPQAQVQTGSGGNIDLNADNNASIGNLNSSSSFEVTADSQSLDSFSIIRAILDLDIGSGGDINLQAGNDLNTDNISSNVAIRNDLVSNAETSPAITLSVSQIGLNIPQAEAGSGGKIFLQAGENINSGTLDSSVSATNIANTSTFVTASNPEIAPPERPARGNSQISVTYDDLTLNSGGTITISSETARIGSANSSITVTSENTVFAQAIADNEAGANALAEGNNSLNVIGDRPGDIAFNVPGRLEFSGINRSATSNNGINNLDAVVSSNSPNASADADAPGTNQLFFDSQVNLALIAFDLDAPDQDEVVDYSAAEATKLANNNQARISDAAQLPITRDSAPIVRNSSTSQQSIKTTQGVIYPATAIRIINGQVSLVSQ